MASAAPEVHIAQNDVQRARAHDERDLIEADAAHVRGQRDMRIAADEAHALDAPGRILAEFDVVLVERAQNTDTRLYRPDLVGVEPDIPQPAAAEVAHAAHGVDLFGRL